jgi:endonuclease/exonuclease/phosphatase family metal-dependent hydrolase
MSIRVATLNTWSLPGPLARHTRERMQAIGEALPNLDVDLIAFQEVWSEKSRGTLIAAASKAGYPHAWHNPAAIAGSGLLVVSRLPFLDTHFEPFVARGFAERIQHMDYYSGKGFVLISIETEAGPIVLLDTHLHANYALPGESDDYVGVRAAQTVQLAAAVTPLTDPVIAVGDFNLVESEDAFSMLLGLAGFTDAAARLDHRQPTSLANNPYHRLGHIDQRIDYVLLRNGDRLSLGPVSIQRVFDQGLEFGAEPAAYSDHAGLVAELELESAAQSRTSPDPAALKIAAKLLEEGRMISERRKRRHRLTAGGAVAAGLGALTGSRRAGRSRRRFLSNGLGFVSGLAFAGFLEQAWLSELMSRGELAGYDFAERQLAELRGLEGAE